MNKRERGLLAGGLFATVVLGAATVQSVPEMIEFRAGTPVRASEFNTNFTNLADAVQTLEDEVAELQTQLAEARSAAGYVTTAAGAKIPYYRKVFTGTKNSTTTVVIPHGIAGTPASERRFINCHVTGNYVEANVPKQTIALNEPSGSTSTALWCVFDDSALIVEWGNSNFVEFQVFIDYTLHPFE